MKTSPPISLPQGVRDILPDEAEKIARVESAILSTFRKYGFKRVVTPLLEYVDVLSRGMGAELKANILKFIDPSTGMVMAIRPDITPQIARLVSMRMRDFPLPLKLCYNESVFRYRREEKHASKEILHIGAEYISKEASPAIDAEMIIMAAEALKKTGLRDFKIDIGDVGFVKRTFSRLTVDEERKKSIKDAVAKKDNPGLEAILKDLGGRVKSRDKKLLLALTTFYGEKEVVKKAMALSSDAGAKKQLEYLRKVLDIIGRKGYMGSITVDLGEVRSLDYYTGIIFEGFAGDIGKTILGGGRYDTLLGKYGYPAGATGFAINTENMVSALERNARLDPPL
ncbi:MAG: ATP phosphoribosyltransferase regulatory subunit [Deltaproteobacteria bacterium]|nr:ATP phosphoribosyltransferase regulatory subunit [Deltaproteobacteria bacterium]